MSALARLDALARRHPRWLRAALILLACAVAVLLFAQPERPVILYQEF